MDMDEAKPEIKSNILERDDDVDGLPFDEVDGLPLGETETPAPKEDLDGMPLKAPKTPLLKSSAAISALQGYDDDDEEEDIDGAPLDDEDVDGTPLGSSRVAPSAAAPGFVSTKWESVSPQRVESQAMTLSKWDTLEAHQNRTNGEDSDSTPVYDQPGSPSLEEKDNHQAVMGKKMINIYYLNQHWLTISKPSFYNIFQNLIASGCHFAVF